MTFDAARLQTWLGARHLLIEGTPAAGGWTNETVFLNADGRALVDRKSTRLNSSHG